MNVAENRRARYEYEILDTFEAGIVLTGDEVKSVRAGHMSIVDCYGFVKNDECYLRNSFIKEYANSFDAGRLGDNTRRDRKLLLHSLEIEKIKKRIEIDRLTLVPLRAYFKDGRLKVEIAIARGKHLYDKRETMKKRDVDRQMTRIFKG